MRVAAVGAPGTSRSALWLAQPTVSLQLHDHAEAHARDAASDELPGGSEAAHAAGSEARDDGSDAGGDAEPEGPGAADAGAVNPELGDADAARGPDPGTLSTTEQAATTLSAPPEQALAVHQPAPASNVQRSSLARGASITQLGEFVARRVREGSKSLSELQCAPDSAAPSVQRLFVGLLWSATQHNAKAVQMEHQVSAAAPHVCRAAA